LGLDNDLKVYLPHLSNAFGKYFLFFIQNTTAITCRNRMKGGKDIILAKNLRSQKPVIDLDR